MKRTCRHNSDNTKKSKVYCTCECGTEYYLDYSLSYIDIKQEEFLKMDKQENCEPAEVPQCTEEMEKHENHINGISPIEDINLEKNCGKRKINSLNKRGEIPICCNNEFCNDPNACCNNNKERRVRNHIGDTGPPFIIDDGNVHNIKASDDWYHYGNSHHACPFTCCQHEWKRECGEGNIEEMQREKREEEITKKEDGLEENACFYRWGNSCNTSNTFYLEINAMLKELHFSKLQRNRFKKKDDSFC